MKRKLLKAMACAMSVCMLSMSLAGCGDDSNSGSSTPGSSTPDSSTPDSSTPDSTPDDSQGAGDDTVDQSNGLFPAYDFGGITLTVLGHNDLGGLDPDAEGIEDYQKAERQEKKDYIEKKYNVTLQFVPNPTDDWDNISQEIIQQYISGSPVADIMDAYYQFMGSYVKNDILYDFTSDLASSNQFVKDEYFQWMGKTWGISRGIGGEGLYYNKKMIEELGMEKTPAEMFDEGHWSYDDCYNYLLDLKSRMGDDEYPLFVSPYYWMLFASAANGEIILDPSGNLNYCTDPMLETLEFYQKLVQSGLNAVPAVTNEDGTVSYNNWGYAGDTFDKGETVAIAHRASWQAASVVGTVELGFVPYPWGSNVTISQQGNSGDYLTLSDNYKSCYFDGQLLCLTKGIEKKANPVEVLSMVLEWMGWDSSMAAFVPEEDDGSSCTWLEDGLDKDLYLYACSRERLEPFNSVDITFTLATNATLYGGASVRSAMESFYNQDMALMIDAGYADESVFTPFEEEGGEGEEGEESSEATE